MILFTLLKGDYNVKQNFSKRFYMTWLITIIAIPNVLGFVDVLFWTYYAYRGGVGGFPIFTFISVLITPLVSTFITVGYIVYKVSRQGIRLSYKISHIVTFIVSLIPITYLVLYIPGYFLGIGLT